jgi:S1-C subfamily serine protease
VAFGAEEHGMAGSLYYVSHPAFPLGNHVAMLNLEKLGRSPEKPLTVGGASAPGWQEVIKAAKERTKTDVAVTRFTTPDSDHYPFSAVRIPAVMMLVSSAVDAHQPSDTADKIDFARTAEAARYAMAMLLTLADQTARLAYTPSPIPDPGLIGNLATNAEADAAGLSGDESGFKVTGVIPGSPSAEAGLMAGDLILDFANYKFRRSDTLAQLVAKQREVLEGKFGNSLSLTVLRAKQRSQRVIKLR